MNTIDPKNKFQILQRRLRLNKRLFNFNYRGERTFVVVSGMNSDKFNLSQVKGLNYYEERMLFFLFLLKYKKTKIVYVTSEDFNTSLFDYYINLISSKKKEVLDIQSRLIHISVKDNKFLSLTDKIIHSKKAIKDITSAISDKKSAALRCYNPTAAERELAIALDIPLFGSREKFDYVGTKSGSRKVFKLAELNLIPGSGYLKNFSELCLAMAKLIKDYPTYKRMVIKLDQGAAGRGNCVFSVENFLEHDEIEISVKTNLEKLSCSIHKQFKNYSQFELENETAEHYIKEFNKIGGIAELYISGKIKYSPSVQLSISTAGIPSIVSTHEQILGGMENQKYLGCAFPALPDHRKLIIKEAKKVSAWMARKGMIGHFGIDFIAMKNKQEDKPKVYPIEINLRKGGTTHPFRIAYYLTRSKYNKLDGILYNGKTPIYYISRDFIVDEKYKKFEPNELIELVQNSKINFNKNTKKGVLVFMSGTIREYGRFGAICIGHSPEDAQIYFKKLLRLVNTHSAKA